MDGEETERGLCEDCETVFWSVGAAERHVENSPYCRGSVRAATEAEVAAAAEQGTEDSEDLGVIG
jgi:hypothetical protein